MTQSERRQWLISYLLKEQKKLFQPKMPAGREDQENLLRSLMNVRMPDPISEEFLEIQDAYLQERNRERGITDIWTLCPGGSDPQLYIWQGDITTLRCGAIVNACNSEMLGCFAPMHSCIDNFIHTYAGVELRLTMNDIMEAQGHEEPTGQAKITSAFNLPADYVLHTVGPIVRGDLTGYHRELLASCYKSCLNLAEEKGIDSIAFCCLSTGVFMFPNDAAAEIAVSTVRGWLADHHSNMKVIFNVFKDIDRRLYEALLA